MHDGFGTIKDGYFVPHSHELRQCGCGRLLLVPAGSKNLREALAEAMAPGTLRSSGEAWCPCG